MSARDEASRRPPRGDVVSLEGDATSGVPPTLSCETVERRLAAGSTGPAVAAHLRVCEACRRDAEEGAPVRAALAPVARTDTVPDPLFVPAVLARVRDEPAPVRRSEARSRALRAAGFAAAVVVAAVAALDPGSPSLPPAAAPLASYSDDVARADEFLLGGESGGYLPCEWIPSGSPESAGSAEVSF